MCAAPCSILDLPSETLAVVCRHVQQQDLLALASTSHRLSAVALRQLYRKTLLFTSSSRSGVFTLARNAELAQHVRELDVVAHFDDADTLTEFITVLGQALANLIYAVDVRLSLRFGPAAAVKLPVTASRALLAPVARSACHTPDNTITTEYTQLRSFACDLALDDHMIQFLSRCPALVSLQLGESSSESLSSVANLAPTIVPNLEHLIASPSAARVLVPGRPVSALDMTFTGEASGFDQETLEAVAQSAAPLVVLNATTADFHLEDLCRVANTLGSQLCSLRMSVLNALDRAPDTVRHIIWLADNCVNVCL